MLADQSIVVLKGGLNDFLYSPLVVDSLYFCQEEIAEYRAAVNR